MLPVRHDTRGRVYSESTAVDARHSGNRLQVPDSPVFPGFRGFQPSKFQGNGGIGSPRFPIRPETGIGVPGEAGRGHRGLRVTPSGGGPFCCGYSKVLKSRGLLILLKPSLVSDEGAYIIVARPKATS